MPLRPQDRAGPPAHTGPAVPPSPPKDAAVPPTDADTDTPARADLAAVRERHAKGLDEARPEAVAKRREKGRRTARENLAELVDEGTYVEYGPLIFAAQ